MRFAAVAACLALVSCQKVPKSPNDTTKPSVQIKVQRADNQFTEKTNLNLSVGGSAKLMCVVFDP